jgi:hypothetical protein
MAKAWESMDWPNARNSTNSSEPKQWTRGGYDFALVVRKDWHAVMWKKAIGSDVWTESYDLVSSPLPALGLIDHTDAHNVPVFCLDSLGYIHVTGNQHDHADGILWLRSVNPYDIGSWTVPDDELPGQRASSDGFAVSTYNHFRSFSDGEVLWFTTMSSAIENPSVNGRDVGAWRIPVGSSTPQAMLASGCEFMTALGGAPNSDAIPDRAYMMGIHIDEEDVVHYVGVWRIQTGDGNTQTELFYVRSYDRGLTWKNAKEEAVATPLTYRLTLDGTAGVGAAAIRYAGGPVGATTGGNIAVKDGIMYYTCNPLDTSSSVYWWNGTDWSRWTHPLTPAGFQLNATMMLGKVGNELWLMGYDAVTSYVQDGGTQKGNLMAVKFDPLSPPTQWAVNMGRMSIGTHTADGTNYTFENGACFWPCEPHCGGRVLGRNRLRIMFPDGDEPVHREVGGKRRFKLV